MLWPMTSDAMVLEWTCTLRERGQKDSMMLKKFMGDLHKLCDMFIWLLPQKQPVEATDSGSQEN